MAWMARGRSLVSMALVRKTSDLPVDFLCDQKPVLQRLLHLNPLKLQEQRLSTHLHLHNSPLHLLFKLLHHKLEAPPSQPSGPPANPEASQTVARKTRLQLLDLSQALEVRMVQPSQLVGLYSRVDNKPSQRSARLMG